MTRTCQLVSIHRINAGYFVIAGRLYHLLPQSAWYGHTTDIESVVGLCAGKRDT